MVTAKTPSKDVAITDAAPHRTRTWFAFDGFATVMLVLYTGMLVALILADISYVRPTHFVEVLRNPELQYAIRLSLITTTITVVLTLLFAVPVGYALSRFRFPGLRLVDAIADIPIVLPHLVVGLSLLVFFQTPIGQAIEESGLRFVYTPAGVVLAQFVIVSAYAIRTMKASFDSIDPRMENVARTLGWSKTQAFRRVTLPLARNGIIAGAIFAWAQALGLFGPLMIFAGTTRYQTEVMATSVYLELSVGNLETAIAIAIIMIVIAMISLLAFKRLAKGGNLW